MKERFLTLDDLTPESPSRKLHFSTSPKVSKHVYTPKEAFLSLEQLRESLRLSVKPTIETLSVSNSDSSSFDGLEVNLSERTSRSRPSETEESNILKTSQRTLEDKSEKSETHGRTTPEKTTTEAPAKRPGYLEIHLLGHGRSPRSGSATATPSTSSPVSTRAKSERNAKSLWRKTARHIRIVKQLQSPTAIVDSPQQSTAGLREQLSEKKTHSTKQVKPSTNSKPTSENTWTDAQTMKSDEAITASEQKKKEDNSTLVEITKKSGPKQVIVTITRTKSSPQLLDTKKAKAGKGLTPTVKAQEVIQRPKRPQSKRIANSQRSSEQEPKTVDLRLHGMERTAHPEADTKMHDGIVDVAENKDGSSHDSQKREDTHEENQEIRASLRAALAEVQEPSDEEKVDSRQDQEKDSGLRQAEDKQPEGEQQEEVKSMDNQENGYKSALQQTLPRSERYSERTEIIAEESFHVGSRKRSATTIEYHPPSEMTPRTTEGILGHLRRRKSKRLQELDTAGSFSTTVVFFGGNVTEQSAASTQETEENAGLMFLFTSVLYGGPSPVVKYAHADVLLDIITTPEHSHPALVSTVLLSYRRLMSGKELVTIIARFIKEITETICAQGGLIPIQRRRSRSKVNIDISTDQSEVEYNSQLLEIFLLRRGREKRITDADRTTLTRRIGLCFKLLYVFLRLFLIVDSGEDVSGIGEALLSLLGLGQTDRLVDILRATLDCRCRRDHPLDIKAIVAEHEGDEYNEISAAPCAISHSFESEEGGVPFRVSGIDSWKSLPCQPDLSGPFIDRGAFQAWGFAPPEIARQITMYESALFQRIRSCEFLDQAWNSKERRKAAPNILRFVQHFNDVSMWVQASILLCETFEQRRAMLKKAILLGQELLNIGNLNGVFEVTSALQSSPIKRLTKLWTSLKEKYLRGFRDLEKLLDPSMNYKSYKDLFQASIAAFASKRAKKARRLYMKGIERRESRRLSMSPSAAPHKSEVISRGLKSDVPLRGFAFVELELLRGSYLKIDVENGVYMLNELEKAGFPSAKNKNAEQDENFAKYPEFSFSQARTRHSHGYLGCMPVIPYLGVHLSDLTFVEDGNRSRTEEGLLNVTKLRRIGIIIGDIRECQDYVHNFLEIREYQDFLFHIGRQTLSQNELYKISLAVEPRGSEKA